MSKPAGFPQQLADVLRQNCLPVQTAGMALAVGGFAGLWWLAPTNRAAQLSAALFGVAIIVFTQFFASLRKLNPEERRALEAAGTCCLALCLAGTLGATGYHWAANRRAGTGGSGGGGSAAQSGPGQGEITFASDDPNKLVIQVPFKNAKDVVVVIEKIWVLTPDNAPPETLDWPLADVEIPAEPTLPHKIKAIAGEAVPIQLTLVPVPPTASADPVQVEKGWVTRVKIAKPAAKDYVFLLRVELVPRQGKAVSVGSVVYFPDLKTKYEKPLPANQDALKEIAAIQAPKSPKLADLLSKK